MQSRRAMRVNDHVGRRFLAVLVEGLRAMSFTFPTASARRLGCASSWLGIRRHPNDAKFGRGFHCVNARSRSFLAHAASLAGSPQPRPLIHGARWSDAAGEARRPDGALTNREAGQCRWHTGRPGSLSLTVITGPQGLLYSGKLEC